MVMSTPKAPHNHCGRSSVLLYTTGRWLYAHQH